MVRHRIFHFGDPGEDSFLSSLFRDDLEFFVADYGVCKTLDSFKNAVKVINSWDSPVTKPNILLGAESPSQHCLENLPTFFGNDGFNNDPCSIDIGEDGMLRLEDWGDIFLSQLDTNREFRQNHVVITGPSTSALTFLQRLSAHPHVKIDAIWMMAGAFLCPGNAGDSYCEDGKYHQVAEFNVYVDPHAFQGVLEIAKQNGIPVKIIPWDCAGNFYLTKSEVEELSESNKTQVILKGFLRRFFGIYGDDTAVKNQISEPRYSPIDLAVAYAMEGKGVLEPGNITVETGKERHGQTKLVHDGSGYPVEILQILDTEDACQWLKEKLEEI